MTAHVISMCLTVGTARNSLDQPVVWLVIFLTTVVCIMPMMAVRFIKTDCYPTQTDKVTKHMLNTIGKENMLSIVIHVINNWVYFKVIET